MHDKCFCFYRAVRERAKSLFDRARAGEARVRCELKNTIDLAMLENDSWRILAKEAARLRTPVYQGIRHQGCIRRGMRHENFGRIDGVVLEPSNQEDIRMLSGKKSESWYAFVPWNACRLKKQKCDELPRV